jgi:primase-polymerase (primpol)-like protein
LIASAGLRHDSEVLAHAARAKNGATFTKLWKGEWQGLGYTSQSEADAALLNMLRF